MGTRSVCGGAGAQAPAWPPAGAGRQARSRPCGGEGFQGPGDKARAGRTGRFGARALRSLCAVPRVVPAARGRGVPLVSPRRGRPACDTSPGPWFVPLRLWQNCSHHAGLAPGARLSPESHLRPARLAGRSGDGAGACSATRMCTCVTVFSLGPELHIVTRPLGF